MSYRLTDLVLLMRYSIYLRLSSSTVGLKFSLRYRLYSSERASLSSSSRFFSPSRCILSAYSSSNNFSSRSTLAGGLYFGYLSLAVLEWESSSLRRLYSSWCCLSSSMLRGRLSSLISRSRFFFSYRFGRIIYFSYFYCIF